MIGMHFCGPDEAGSFQLSHFRKKKIQILNQFLELGLICVLHFSGNTPGRH